MQALPCPWEKLRAANLCAPWRCVWHTPGSRAPASFVGEGERRACVHTHALWHIFVYIYSRVTRVSRHRDSKDQSVDVCAKALAKET
eukprot:scaffold40512_cov81-Phaeocystis_antarctica.AAC.2